MYTGTLIEHSIAAVERAEAEASLTATGSSSDFISPFRTLDDTACLVAAEDFALANAHMWAVPSARRIRLGTMVRSRSRFKNLQLPPSW